jgi:hypothetical protein
MPIAVATSRQFLADQYKTLGPWIGAATANPGTTAPPVGEASGGVPAYARKQTAWTSGAGGVINGGPVTVDVPTGTYTWILLASAVSGANMVDTSDVTDVVMSAQGQLVITPTYTQT